MVQPNAVLSTALPSEGNNTSGREKHRITTKATQKITLSILGPCIFLPP